MPAGKFRAGRELRNGDRSVFTVPAASQRDALERVWALGGEVLSVNPVRRTLEEVFVELTNTGSRRVKLVVLIAANFLARASLAGLILFAWIVLTALAAGGFGRDRAVAEDVVFYVQQQAIYICVFSAFLAADAIHNERKSRRILLVLSKAISRGEYLLAIILGTWAVAIRLCCAVRRYAACG